MKRLQNINKGIISNVKNNKKKSKFWIQGNFLRLTNNINNNTEYNKKDNNIKTNNQINHNGVHTITTNVEIGENEQQKRNIISKIKITRAYIYLCFCCIRRRKKMYNYLLDEGMRIIKEKMDIFYIFNKMYKDEEITENETIKKTIEMSDKCKVKIDSL